MGGGVGRTWSFAQHVQDSAVRSVRLRVRDYLAVSYGKTECNGCKGVQRAMETAEQRLRNNGMEGLGRRGGKYLAQGRAMHCKFPWA